MEQFISQAAGNLAIPAVLFFVIGMAAALVKSSLHFPDALVKSLSIYLLIAIGFKGGYEISKSGIDAEIIQAAMLSVTLSALIPIFVFFILKLIFRFDTVNAGALAAHYGSVSVVTFVTATLVLEKSGVAFSGYMVGMMALMEFPAILIAILMVNLFRKGERSGKGSMKLLIHESLTNQSVVLLIGGMVTGYITGERGKDLVEGFFFLPFQGILALFLLELGLVAGSKLHEFKSAGFRLVVFGISMPILVGLVTAFLTVQLGFSEGNAHLFSVLAASASYIAAPAAVRLVLPEANPSFYVTASLAITFPFNIIAGIPLYHIFVKLFL